MKEFPTKATTTNRPAASKFFLVIIYDLTKECFNKSQTRSPLFLFFVFKKQSLISDVGHLAVIGVDGDALLSNK